MPPQGGRDGANVLLNEDLAFDLDRLFDEHNMDHIPVEHRLDTFKKRNLPFVKHYKAAVKIFGGPLSRKRIIIAPPMETPLKHKLGVYVNKMEFPPAPVLNSVMQHPNTSCIVQFEQKAQLEVNTEEAMYKKWFKERKALQENLNSLGLSEQLLRRKTDKTELELRVEARMKAARTRKPEIPPPKEPEPKPRGPPVIPNVRAPMPLSLQILDRFLVDNKLRLIDLFAHADRNKDWRLTKHELKKAIENYRIPLKQGDIEDLMVMLDQDFDECLGYAEVSRGLAALRMERRALKRRGQVVSATTLSRSSPSSILPKISPLSYARDSTPSSYSDRVMKDSESPKPACPETRGSVIVEEDTTEKPENQVRTASEKEAAGNAESRPQTRSRTSTLNSLELPPRDLREECWVAASEEEMMYLRKRDRVVLEKANTRKWPCPDKKGKHDEAPGIIRIGQKAVDEHCMESTLDGETGALLNAFRQNSLKEYFQAVELCSKNGLVLTPGLLDRVLLHPPELPHAELKKHLRVPRGCLADLSTDVTKSPQLLKILQEGQAKDELVHSRSGTLLKDSSQGHSWGVKAAQSASAENLSTGRAVSNSCMTFEEYETYNKHLPARYKELTGGKRENKGDDTKRTKAGSEGGKKGKKSSDDGEFKAMTKGHRRKKRSKSSQKLSAFWPGYMLDKLVMCIPLLDNGHFPWTQGSSTHFHYTGQPRHAYSAKYYV